MTDFASGWAGRCLAHPRAATAVPQLQAALQAAGVVTSSTVQEWAPDLVVVDLQSATPLTAAAQTVLARWPTAAEEGCDIVAVPSAARGPILLVSDVDSTLIAEEVIEELAQAAGKRAQVAALTEAAMRGELDFATSLTARVSTLAGLPTSTLTAVAASLTPRPFAAQLAAMVHAYGGQIGAVSGGFSEVLAPLAAQLGLDLTAANTLGSQAGHLTGTTVGPVIDRAAKAALLRDWSARSGLRDTVAVGDGANDLDMFAAAELSIALCGKPAARAAADVVLTLPHLGAVAAAIWRHPQWV
ncbi:phosphoserine phosphatase SerB [Buchananella hordeovulneris]|uniref:phosphoserine phosphatase SerB n=1 Tax=Buchananella hordeovulneris TaxID=52770 RepID=UPI001C9E89AE|nr:phosphoserine phosphatase SerB [Buchananella hordeovulneris]